MGIPESTEAQASTCLTTSYHQSKEENEDTRDSQQTKTSTNHQKIKPTNQLIKLLKACNQPTLPEKDQGETIVSSSGKQSRSNQRPINMSKIQSSSS